MGDQLMELIKIFHKVEVEGGQATLSATTHEGKTKLKLEIVSPPSESVLPSSPPAPGRRRRHRGARARARRNQRAAAHQAEAAASAPLAPPLPLRLHPSPPPDSGRRQVMSCLERLPSFSNLDGAPPSSPPCTPSPTPGISSNVEKEEEEEDLPELLLDYGVNALPEFYSTPPAKVRHMFYGIGTFQSINQSGQYCYDFGSRIRMLKVFNKPHGPTAPIF